MGVCGDRRLVTAAKEVGIVVELTGGRILDYCKELSPRSKVMIGVAVTLLAAAETIVFGALGDRVLALLTATLCGASPALTLLLRNGSSSRRSVPGMSPRTRRWLNSIPEDPIAERRLLALAIVVLFAPLLACWALGLLLAADGAQFWPLATGLAVFGFVWSAALLSPRLRYPEHGLRSVR